jgi:hypothetical protein
MSSVPSIEELEQLHSELKLLRQSAVARGKKASDDLRTITDLMRRMKEKEKGKAKAVDKVKRERDCMSIFFHNPSLDSDSLPPDLLICALVFRNPTVPDSLEITVPLNILELPYVVHAPADTPIPVEDSRHGHLPGSKPRMGTNSIPPSARSSVDPRRS